MDATHLAPGYVTLGNRIGGGNESTDISQSVEASAGSTIVNGWSERPMDHSTFANSRRHEYPDLLNILALVDGDIGKFDALQERVVSLRGSSHHLRQQLNFFRREVQRCDGDILKYHYKTLGGSAVNPDQLAQLVDAAQYARDKLGPLEEECERAELEIGMIELQLLEQGGKIRRHVKKSGVNIPLGLPYGAFSNSSCSSETASTFLPDPGGDYDNYSDDEESNGLPYYTRSEAEIIMREQAEQNKRAASITHIIDAHQDDHGNDEGSERQGQPYLTRSEAEMQIQEKANMHSLKSPAETGLIAADGTSDLKIDQEDDTHLPTINGHGKEHNQIHSDDIGKEHVPGNENGLAHQNGHADKNHESPEMGQGEDTFVTNGTMLEKPGTTTLESTQPETLVGESKQSEAADECTLKSRGTANGHVEASAPENGHIQKSNTAIGHIEVSSTKDGNLKQLNTTIETPDATLSEQHHLSEEPANEGLSQRVDSGIAYGAKADQANVDQSKPAQPKQTQPADQPIQKLGDPSTMQPAPLTAKHGSPGHPITAVPPPPPGYPTPGLPMSDSPRVSDWMLTQLRDSKWNQMLYKGYASTYGFQGDINFESKKFSRLWRLDQAEALPLVSAAPPRKAVRQLRVRRSASVITIDGN